MSEAPEEAITASEKLWSLVENGTSTDCTIQILWEPPKSYNMHKMVLVNSSPVFERMFETDMKESRTGIVEITGIDPLIMELTLKHMYGCKLNEDLSREDICDLLIVADRYQIITLKEACAKYANKHLLDPKNVLYLLDHLQLFSDCINGRILEEDLFHMVINESEECIKDEIEIREDTLIKMLNLDKFNLVSELCLITYVNRWAEAFIKRKENIKHVTDQKIRKLIEPRVLPLLRFLSLSFSELTSLFCFFDWLTKSDKNLIYNIIRLRGKDKGLLELLPNYISKNKSIRCKKTIKYYNPELSSQVTVPAHTIILHPTKTISDIKANKVSKPYFSFEFRVDVDDCLLIGVELFTQWLDNYDKEECYHDTRYVKISIEGNVLMQASVTNGFIYYNSSIAVMFHKKVPLHKNATYLFESSYVKPYTLEYFHSTDVIQNNDINVFIKGSIGCLKSLMFIHQYNNFEN